MATSTHRRDTHATTAQGGWSTKRIATTALFCAVAAIATLFIEFPILPGVTFLKYDPSAIVALVAGFAYGPATGAIVSILSYLVHLATESGLYGTFMAIVTILANIVVTPLYMGAPTETVIGMIVPVLLPFNVLKILINCVASALVYKPVSKALEA